MEVALNERLRKIGIFSTALSEPGAVDLLISILKPRSFHAGTILFSEGDEGSEMFILHKGRVRIRKNTPSGEQYTVVLLDEGQNAFFGEVGLLESESRSATVIAETNVECFVINKDDFLDFSNKNPRIGLLITREIAKELSQRLRKSSHDLVTLFTALVSEIEGETNPQPSSSEQE